MDVEWAVALVCATGAAATDLHGRRISNRWLLVCALAAAALQAAHGAYLPALLGGVVGGAVLIVPFWLGGMGAGDVKLLAAVGLALGLSGVILVALLTAVAGGVLALLVRWNIGQAAGWLGTPHREWMARGEWRPGRTWSRNRERSPRGEWTGSREGTVSEPSVRTWQGPSDGAAPGATIARRATIPYAVAVWLGLAGTVAVRLAVGA